MTQLTPTETHSTGLPTAQVTKSLINTTEKYSRDLPTTSKTVVALDWIKQHTWHIFVPSCSPRENLSCLSQQKTVFTATSNLCHSYSRVVYWRGQHKCTSCNRNHLRQKIVQKHNSPRYIQYLILPACTTSLYSNPLLEAIFQGDGTSFCSEKEISKQYFSQNLIVYMRFDICYYYYNYYYYYHYSEF